MLSVILFAVLVTCVAAIRWLLGTWGQIRADEIVYHLHTSLRGTNEAMVHDALVGYALPAVIVVTALAAALVVLRTRPRARAGLACAALVVSAGLAGVSLVSLERETGLISYLAASSGGQGDDFVAQHYVDPHDVEVTFPQARRNLVYIYLESMEMTYADVASGGAFERNVIPELTQLAREGDDFSGDSGQLDGAVTLPGTGWTMGGMFAQSTGLPLKIPFDGNAMTTQEAFFPGVRSLGDILADAGYRQVLLLGSDATFGGRRRFFGEHGGFEMHDYPYALEQGLVPPDYKVFWGYEDEKLFAFARDELLELSAQGEPFNLTMLTVDTHFEDGYVCQLCDDEFGDNQYANVFACSSRQVSEFVRWIQEQDFYENTTIVLCGDHRTMDKDFVSWVDGSYRRRTYTCVINAAATPADPGRRREYSVFDLFPTTLAALGATIEGDRLGLGTNLYSDQDTLLETLGEELRKGLSGPSALMDALGQFSVDEDALAASSTAARLVAAEDDDGRLSFSLSGVNLSTWYVTGAALELTDDRTGETVRLEMEVIPMEDKPASFWCHVTTDYTPEDLGHLSCTALISTEQYQDYVVCTELSED